MTDTTDTAPDAGQAPARRRGEGLDGMLLPELKRIAGGLGIRTTGLRKGALVAAIKEHQAQATAPSRGRDGGQDGRPAGRPDASASDPAASDGGASAARDSAVDQQGGSSRAPETQADPEGRGGQDRQGGQVEQDGTDGGRGNRRARRADVPDSREQDAAEDGGQPSRRGQGQQGGDDGRAGEQQDRQDDDRQDGRRGGNRQGGQQDEQDRQDEDRQGGNRKDGRQGGNRQGGRQDEDQQGDDRQGGNRKDGRQGANRQGGRQEDDQQGDGRQGGNRNGDRRNGRQDDKQGDDQQGGGNRKDGRQDNRQDNRQGNRQDDRQDDDRQGGSAKQDNRQDNRDNRQDGSRQGDDGQGGNRQDDDDEGGSRRNRRRRGRDRDRQNTGGTDQRGGQQQGGAASRGNRQEPDLQVLEDDVLAPCAGILDLMDNYAFVRTSGYLPGADDVYVSMSLVRRFGLRRGDAVVGQVRQPREGERREKFNPLVRIDSVNGSEPQTTTPRVEFDKLTPLHPSERLRLETTPDEVVGRVVDLLAPVGKGQRGLVVAPAGSGGTRVLQSVARAVTTNNPECHLMVVLIDERPEEVTDFQRAVKGEVISSTFDRPASDHTIVAELAIERAKRLVELGHDVVVLVDGLTRLGRAYAHSTAASGRVLAGGVDATALHPPRRFFGAARNIEDGGSLTILATALVESGSAMDEVIFEELEGTGNMELRLNRDLAERRVFPAVDPVRSGTRREELLLGQGEQSVVGALRRQLAEQEGHQAVEALLARLRSTQTNLELLQQVQRSASSAGAGS